jgi:hypothetical protein
MNVYTLQEGTELVTAARSAIELYLTNPNFNKRMIMESIKKFTDKKGVFVTLEHYPTRTLRGCIGFPMPVASVCDELVEAALAAAFEDPRFVSVSKPELEHLVAEVSILSEQKELMGAAAAREKEVVIGKDGLVVRYGVHSGLLLPIVAVEQGWDAKQFLEEACLKAGLPKGYWSQPNVKIYKFETQVFREESPNGRVTEVNLK